jgi:hypothetical protein
VGIKDLLRMSNKTDEKAGRATETNAAPDRPAASARTESRASYSETPPERPSGREGRPGAPEFAVADAFEAFLAEELGEVATAGFGPDGIELSNLAIDRIAVRVVELLSKGPFGDKMTRIVTDVSERLVREEIAWIRASARDKNA